jgi:CheY-like chemotaxis protein
MSTAQMEIRGTAGVKGTILLVDDHPVNIRLLEKILSAAGYRTLAAETAPPAGISPCRDCRI